MKEYIKAFLKEKPLFFSFIRPKEVSLYQRYKPFKGPILDVGCGDGFFAKVAFGKVDVGIDIGSSEIKEAKQKHIYKVIKTYDGKKIPYGNNYFSTVLCNSTFEHISNLDEVLQEVARVTNTGGRLYFNAPSNKWPTYIAGANLLGEWYKKMFVAKSKHYNMYSIQKWSSVLRKLGFRVEYSTYYIDNKKIMKYFEIAHYVSIPSLITKKLFNKWVLFPEKERGLIPLEEFIAKETAPNTKKGAYLFIVAKKFR